MSLPTGNLTFLFTDIEGSSRLWENHPETMGTALALHDQILRESIAIHRGQVFKTIGDAFCAVFNAAPDAVTAATTAQLRFVATAWQTPDPIKVRMALHTGVAELRDADYFGQTLNRVARLLAIGHGGQTLLSLATEELVGDRLPDGVSLRFLGEKRLKDLTRPERIFELSAEGLRADFPPLRSLERFPNNLPVQLTSFIGREKELAKVKKMLATTHLLTLTGAGGTGKTRLSLQAAADVLEEYSDGVWLVELATISDPDDFPATVAEVLGVRAEPDLSITATITNFLRTKALLLIFDNCEHLVGPVAWLAENLLRAAPGLRLLASSRTPLGIAGESTWPVPALSLPTLTRWGELQHYSLEDLGAFEAIRLFVDRAAAVQAGFRLTNENASAISKICYRLDGIALAIELAAARVKVLPPAEIAKRLENRFQLLTGGSRTALPRQQTLRALIDWSYDLLTEKERMLFRRLAVFAGGRTLEAVEGVCAGDDLEAWETLDLLTQLFDKSLVSIEEGPQGVPRYVLTESVWQYAQEKLAGSPESEAMHDRHLTWFGKLAGEASPHLLEPEQSHWLEKLAPDRINFRLALEWSRTSAARIEQGLALAVNLSRFWEVRSDLQEGREHFEELLSRADRTPRLLLAHALGSAGRLAWCQDANQVARQYAIEAIAMFQALGDEVYAGAYLATRGFVERLEEETDLAEQLFQEALEIGVRLHNARLRGLALAGLGSIAGDRGNHALGKEYKFQSVKIFREVGDRYVLSLNSWSIGRLSLQAGEYDAAYEYYRECAVIAFELGNRWVVPHLLEDVGAIAGAKGEPEKGVRLFATASVMRERLGLNFAPADLQVYEKYLAVLKTATGPARFAELWTEGRRTDPPTAVELAFPGVLKLTK